MFNYNHVIGEAGYVDHCFLNFKSVFDNHDVEIKCYRLNGV